jgi:hypothetical protein
VVYIRPGHETYPIWKDDHMLRLLENAVRWRRGGKRGLVPRAQHVEKRAATREGAGVSDCGGTFSNVSVFPASIRHVEPCGHKAVMAVYTTGSWNVIPPED